MSITKEELIEVLNAQHRYANSTNGVWDVLLKIGTGVSTTGIVALAGLIASFNSDINTLAVQQQYASEQMKLLQDKLDRFALEPKFDMSDFKSQIEPIKQKVDKHDVQLGDMADISQRLGRVEAELRYIGKGDGR